MSEPTADRDAAAELLKRYFNAAKSEQRGQAYRPAARYRTYELWAAIADLCIELKADPYDFVRAAFLYCAVPGGPFPQNLAANCARRWYEQYRQASVKNGKVPDKIFKAEISSMITSLGQQMMRSGKRPRDFLLDTYLVREDAAPAFARVLLLPKDPAIMAKFGKKARSEIIGNQKLLSILKELNLNLDWLETVK